jgi:NAD(P)-dependent dehydrogenase (short-subunit alcohol dehydrogenase family)
MAKQEHSMRSIFDLEGRRTLVIGAGGGIGAVLAQGLSDFGAYVYCADVDGSAATVTAESVTRAGGASEAMRLDVTDPDDVGAAANALGDLDVVVLTAAMNIRKRLADLTLDEFRRVQRLNLEGSFLVIREFGARMAERRAGSIIVYSSIRAQVVEPGQGVYAATKAGVLQLVRTAAAELGPFGVRVNTIAPGVVDTPLTASIKADAEWYAAYANKSVLGRWARPEELVGATVFLASDASSYVTGAYLTVDGGWLAADGRYAPRL